jgi:hypothetical protein
MKLEYRYEAVCNAYVEKFCKKQNMDFEGWIGSTVGGVVG